MLFLFLFEGWCFEPLHIRLWHVEVSSACTEDDHQIVTDFQCEVMPFWAAQLPVLVVVVFVCFMPCLRKHITCATCCTDSTGLSHRNELPHEAGASCCEMVPEVGTEG